MQIELWQAIVGYCMIRVVMNTISALYYHLNREQVIMIISDMFLFACIRAALFASIGLVTFEVAGCMQ